MNVAYIRKRVSEEIEKRPELYVGRWVLILNESGLWVIKAAKYTPADTRIIEFSEVVAAQGFTDSEWDDIVRKIRKVCDEKGWIL